MTSPSKPYWQLLTFFFKVDFPFRLLTFTTLFSSLIAGAGMILFKKNELSKGFASLAVFGLLLLAFYGNRNHLRVNQYLDQPDSFYQKHLSSSSSFDEYRPRWVNPKFFPKREAPLVIFDSQAKIEILAIESNRQAYQVDVQKEGALILNTISYPGWQLLIDGQKEVIEMVGNAGLMKFHLPTGEHEVAFNFGRTWDRILGEGVTLGTLVFIGYQARRKWRKKKRKRL
jgi:hypothetical protein